MIRNNQRLVTLSAMHIIQTRFHLIRWEERDICHLEWFEYEFVKVFFQRNVGDPFDDYSDPINANAILEGRPGLEHKWSV